MASDILESGGAQKSINPYPPCARAHTHTHWAQSGKSGGLGRNGGQALDLESTLLSSGLAPCGSQPLGLRTRPSWHRPYPLGRPLPSPRRPHQCRLRHDTPPHSSSAPWRRCTKSLQGTRPSFAPEGGSRCRESHILLVPLCPAPPLMTFSGDGPLEGFNFLDGIAIVATNAPVPW